MRNLFLISFFVLTACPNPDCEGEDCDTETDTSIDPDNAGTLIVQPTWLGDAIDCTVNADAYFGEDYRWDVTGTPQSQVLPVGEYAIGVGDGDYGGVPGHTLASGQVIVSPKVDVEVVKDTEKTVPLPLNTYFNGEYVCTYQVWQYDGSRPDHKGQPGTNGTDPKTRVHVEMGYKVQADHENFQGFLQGGWLETEGNTFVYVNPDNPNGWYLQASKIESSFFEVELVRPNNSVVFKRCTKQ